MAPNAVRSISMACSLHDLGTSPDSASADPPGIDVRARLLRVAGVGSPPNWRVGWVPSAFGECQGFRLNVRPTRTWRHGWFPPNTPACHRRSYRMRDRFAAP